MIFRHLLSILLLPFMVVVAMPWWLQSRFADADTRWLDGSLLAKFARLIGFVVLAIGLALFIWCIKLFVQVGQGTLAPWDPTRKLVAIGPYRHVRNPMISAVVLLLIGQALWWGSLVIAAWAGIFILLNQAYFILSEEPGLEARFGESYRLYKAEVPRWVPRLSRRPRRK